MIRFFNQIIDFFKQILVELRNVTWITREQLVRSTVIVIATSVVISLFLFLNDLIFSKLIFILLQK